jgi:hypothetical protein
VVTTGAAVSTIWADEGSKQPHMVTKANDKVAADRADVEAEIAPLNQKIHGAFEQRIMYVRRGER